MYYPHYRPCNTHIPPQHYYGFYHPYVYTNRQYPQVDPTLFNESTITMQNLMKDASTVLGKIADSKEFAVKLMMEAQQSNTNEVERLIKSTGVQSKVDTTYTPDGINLHLSGKVGDTDCCHLTIALRWR